ncbi:dTDP-glucose 4,6-dehydratase [Planctomycetes bacterium Pan216]|uniref:dTDP-glucose 4,6-dehydratase n=1 Tax=Kolteria novifilia TaxID=2527975 RepID=A0A518B7Q2_9BACT|nr:dTDP-glucose 4,6-dehydratase [Planctomycetes bacterium Pan216]
MLIGVTGGTGFIGRYLVERLISKGHRLRCWRRPQSDLKPFRKHEDSIEWIEGDLSDEVSIDQLVEGVDAVVHSALERPGDSSFRQASQVDVLAFTEMNFLGSLRLMEKARRQNVDRFVHVSTCAVHEIILEDRPLDEAHPVWPKTHYGAHKAALEAYVASYGYGQDWPICAVRPCGVYGVARPVKNSKWYGLVGRVMAGEKISTKEGGKEVHAADVAKAIEILLLADKEAVTGRCFNCCDQYVSKQHVAEIVKRLTDSPSEIDDLAKGPKHQIVTTRLEELGMKFGGEALLEETIGRLIKAHEKKDKSE